MVGLVRPSVLPVAWRAEPPQDRVLYCAISSHGAEEASVRGAHKTAIALLAAGVAAFVALRAPEHARPRGERVDGTQRSQAAEQSLDLEARAAVPSQSALAPSFDSERVWGTWNDWEPAVAADPVAPYVYQLATRYNGTAPCRGCEGPWIVFRRSVDGGSTWGPDRHLTVTEGAFNDPQIEVAADGTIYVVYLEGYEPGVTLVRSADRGDTWSAPIAIAPRVVAPGWSDKPILAVSADGADVYVAFNASDSYVAASHDRGASFGNPVRTSFDTRYWFHTGGAVAPDGTVYFAAVDYSQTYEGESHIDVLCSRDAGESWTTTLLDTSAEAPGCAWSAGCYLGFLGPSAGLAVDAAGLVVVAYPAGDSPGAPQRLYVRTSADGVSWGPRLEVGSGHSSVNGAFPALAAGPNAGDFRLAFQDDRNGIQATWNTWHRRTADGGASWTEAVRISDRDSGASYKSAAGYRFPYGDYFELSVDSAGLTHAIWGEGASYDGPGGVWHTRGL